MFAETCPHYLALDDSRYELPASGGVQVRHLAAASSEQPSVRSCGAASPMAHSTLVATDHVPDRVAIEKQNYRESFDKISNGGPGIETLLTIVYSEGVAKAGSRSSGWSTS